jgi:hypothetical protein
MHYVANKLYNIPIYATPIAVYVGFDDSLIKSYFSHTAVCVAIIPFLNGARDASLFIYTLRYNTENPVFPPKKQKGLNLRPALRLPVSSVTLLP